MTAPSIYACYRREDCPFIVGRIVAELRGCFGPHTVFQDVDTIHLGGNWPDSLQRALESAAVILVFIGEKWHGSWDVDHGPRLWHPRDWVRKEIVAGLEAVTKTVIPVLIDAVQLPKSPALPAPLRPITKIQNVRIRHSDYHSDLEKLMKSVGSRINASFAVEAWGDALHMQVSQSMYRVPPGRASGRGDQ